MKRMPTHLAVLGLWSLFALCAPVLAQQHPELEALDGEWYRLASDGQYDAALEVLQQRLQIAERLSGPESDDVAESFGKIGNTYARYKDDDATAKKYFERALAIYESHPTAKYDADPCRTMQQLGNIAFRSDDDDTAMRYLERALDCMEEKQGTRSWISVATMNDLGAVYRSQPTRPDMVAKADQLFRRWLPIIEQIGEVQDILRAGLLGEQAKFYAKRKEWLTAGSLRGRALDIVENHPKESRTDREREWLKLHVDLLVDQVMAYRQAHDYNNDPEVFEYQARLVAAEGKFFGENHSRTAHSRELLEEWRSEYFYVPESVRRPGESPWIYDDVDHGQCVDVQADNSANTGHAMAYGRYRLINSCDYPVKLSSCVTTDRADGTPTPEFEQHQDNAKCPSPGWEGTTMRANQKSNVPTWFEYSRIRWDIRVCREGWDFVGEDGEPLPMNSRIGLKYGCRKMRTDEAQVQAASDSKSSEPSQSEESPVCSLSEPRRCFLRGREVSPHN